MNDLKFALRQLLKNPAFGASALLVPVIGVYGVTAFGVAGRTRESGLRMAVGAKPSDVLGLRSVT